jgi:hypothetical protein
MGTALLVLRMNPLRKTLLLFFLVGMVSVPFPKGAPVETAERGTTDWVLMKTTELWLDEEAASLPAMEDTSEEPEVGVASEPAVAV